MTVQLNPVSPRVTAIRTDNDPYKKYWWVILGGFGLTLFWLMIPMMEPGVGSGRVDAGGEAGLAGEGSLDGAANPAGAPGDPLDPTGRPRKPDGSIVSGLYQPPDLPALPAASGAAAPGGTLADALKSVGKSADASGWGGKAPVKGFTPPSAAFGALSGLGGIGGGSASASASVGAFGSRNSEVGFEATRGLSGDLGGDVESLNDLGLAAQKSQAALDKNPDAGLAVGANIFDGKRGGGSGIDGSAGKAGGGASGAFEQLDSAAKNLKVNDPKLDMKKITPPEASVANTDDNRSEEMKQQIAMMIAMTIVGGLLPGAAGSMITSMAPMLMQMNKTDERGSGTTIGSNLKKT